MDSQTVLLVAACMLLACMIGSVSFVICAIRAGTEHDELVQALRDYAYRSPEDEIAHGDWPNVPRH